MGNRGVIWVVVQAALLLLLLVVPRIGPLWPAPDVFRGIGALLVVIGILLLTWSALSMKQSLTAFPRPLPQGRLVTTGPYRFVRHPMYLGVVVGALGLALATHSPLRLAIAAALLVFFNMKAGNEEGWLQEKHPQYAAYKSRVKKLVPWIY